MIKFDPKNQLIFVAERGQKEKDKWQEIVVEIVDTPTVLITEKCDFRPLKMDHCFLALFYGIQADAS